MKTFRKRYFLIPVTVALLLSFQNFSKIDPDPIEKVTQGSSISKEDLLEKEIDLKLDNTKLSTPDQYLAKKCFETRVTCQGNRNYTKCLSDKINQYAKCTKIPPKDLFGGNFKKDINL
jgi:hypothetical protein